MDTVADIAPRAIEHAAPSASPPAPSLIDLGASPVATELTQRIVAYQRTPDERSAAEHMVRLAYMTAYQAHDGQRRTSGEPYIDHPVAVANLLLELRLDKDTIAAALLHDVVEDTRITKEQLQHLFGTDVAHIVDGVTKLTSLEAKNKAEAQAGTYRKMFIAMANDPRVVLVKLADRLHNMRTLSSLSVERQQRIARETIEIYAPLAHRLGIGQMKWELEDRAFAILRPEKYQEITRALASRRDVREKTVQRVIQRLQQLLEKEGVRADISGRPKHVYSIYRKMERKGVSLDQIYDQLAVRVVVDSVGECYRVLGLAHLAWPPVPGEFDDYIANPKESMYQSLHTTVLIPGGQPCEIQIRTGDMHEVAEHGIAAHWRYKEGYGRAEASFDAKVKWLRNLIDWNTDAKDQDFVDTIKNEEFEEQIFVMTPKGRIVDLPAGATPVDFAYRIHSEVGNSCIGSKVGGRVVPLSYELKNAEIVEIMTSRISRGPSRDWANFAKTAGAKSHIRRFFRRNDRSENITEGRKLLERELKRLAISIAHEEVAQHARFSSADEMFAQIGSTDVSARTVAQRVLASMTPLVAPTEVPPTQLPHAHRPPVDPGVRVRGESGIYHRLARCCNPVIGEPITGFVTRGNGVTIHRADCRLILNGRDRERIVDVSWGSLVPKGGFPVPIVIDVWDRVGLWRDLSSIIADAGINISEVQQTTGRVDGTTVLRATLQIGDIPDLTRIITKINSLPDVIEARRAS